MPIKLEAVYLIYRDGIPTGFFKRDELSNKNLIYTAKEASLEEIENIINNPKETL